MKQTAVEWFFEQIMYADVDIKVWKEIFEQAKEMEKQQSYSEEDMAESFMACWKANVPEGFECKLSFNEWFEQFKNK